MDILTDLWGLYFIIVIILIGAATRKVRGGNIVQWLVGLIMTIPYVGLRFGVAYSAIEGGMDPLMAIIFPDLIFTAIPLYMLWKAPK
jgi:lipopolysaccharide export system permease protein